MKIRQFIEILSKYNQEAEICIHELNYMGVSYYNSPCPEEGYVVSEDFSEGELINKDEFDEYIKNDSLLSLLTDEELESYRKSLLDVVILYPVY